MNIFISWIGNADLKGAENAKFTKRKLLPDSISGPIVSILKEKGFDKIILIGNTQGKKNIAPSIRKYEAEKISSYTKFTKIIVELCLAKTYVTNDVFRLDSPTNHVEIYNSTEKILKREIKLSKLPIEEIKFTFNLTSGTPAMHAVWMLHGRGGKYDADLLQVSVQAGIEKAEPLVEELNLPTKIFFDAFGDGTAAFDKIKKKREKEITLATYTTGKILNFGGIIYESKVMDDVIKQAKKISKKEINILIEGETGTGKQLLAEQIHNESGRDGKFVEVNCGGFEREFMHTTLFGHTRNAFSGALKEREGVFKHANGGTVFLDEIGNMDIKAQQLLLKVLDENKFLKFGESDPTKAQKVDVRVISASNKKFKTMIAENMFLHDLYYRLNGIKLVLPPLRDRENDAKVLAKKFIDDINRQSNMDENYVAKTLNNKALKVINELEWPGNVRELWSLLTTICILNNNKTITDENIIGKLDDVLDVTDFEILNRPIDDEFNLEKLLAEVTIHYIDKAREKYGTKTNAASKLGIDHYQTMDTRYDKSKELIDTKK